MWAINCLQGVKRSRCTAPPLERRDATDVAIVTSFGPFLCPLPQSPAHGKQRRPHLTLDLQAYSQRPIRIAISAAEEKDDVIEPAKLRQDLLLPDP